MTLFSPALREILLIKPGSLGDVVHALPVAHALKTAHPEARLTWVIDPRWTPIIRDNPAVDAVLEFPRDRFRGPGGWLRGAAWFANLRDRRPDWSIDLQGLLRSGLIARAARSRRVIGLSDAREGGRYLCHETADVSEFLHAVDRYLQVLPLCGIPVPKHPHFSLPSAPAPSGLPHRFVAVHPFARGAGKSLDSESLLALCNALAPIPVVLCGMGTPPATLPSHVLDRTNATTLLELLGLLRAATAVISVDSGPMHLACALQRPLLAIHTWSDPRKVGPYSEDAWILQGGTLRPQVLKPDAPQLAQTDFNPAVWKEVAGWVENIFQSA